RRHHITRRREGLPWVPGRTRGIGRTDLAGGTCRVIVPIDEPHQVAGPACLGPGADRRLLPTAKRLSAHDRAGDAAVDIEVAGLDPLEPLPDLAAVERVQA